HKYRLKRFAFSIWSGLWKIQLQKNKQLGVAIKFRVNSLLQKYFNIWYDQFVQSIEFESVSREMQRRRKKIYFQKWKKQTRPSKQEAAAVSHFNHRMLYKYMYEWRRRKIESLHLSSKTRKKY